MIQFFVYLLSGAWTGFQVFSISFVSVVVVCHYFDVLAFLKRLGFIYPVSHDTSKLTFKTQPANPRFSPDLSTESAKWLNYLIGDIFYGLAGGRLAELCQKSVIEGVDERLSSLQSEAKRLIQALKISQFELGRRPPIIKQVMHKHDGEDLILMIDFAYDGGIAMKLAAQMGLGMRDLEAKLTIRKLSISRLVLKFATHSGCPKITGIITAMPPFTINLMYGERRLGRISTLLHILMTSVLHSKLAVFPRQRSVIIKKTAMDIRNTFEIISGSTAELQARISILGGQIVNEPVAASTSSLLSTTSQDIGNYYCMVIVGKKSEKTKSINSYSPTWKAKFSFDLDDMTDSITVQVYNKRRRLTRAELVGENKVMLDKAILNETQHYRLNMKQSYVELELTISHSQEIDVEQDAAWIFAGLPEGFHSEQAIEDEKVLEKLNWTNIKYVVDRIRAKAKQDKQRGPENSLADITEDDILMDFEGNDEFIATIPSAQQEHISQLLSDWDDHYNGEEEDPLKKVRSMLEVLQHESVSGTATPYRRSSLSEGLKPTPAIQAMIPFIKSQIEPTEDLFLEDVIERLDQLNDGEDAHGKSANFPGPFSIELSSTGVAFTRHEQSIPQSLTLEDHVIEYIPVLDIVAIYQIDTADMLWKCFPIQVLKDPYCVVDRSTLHLGESSYECKTVMEALNFISALSTRYLPKEIELQSITGLRLIHEGGSPVALQLRINEKDFVLTGSNVTRNYADLRLALPSISLLEESPTSYHGTHPSSWLPEDQPLFPCSISYHLSIYRGVLTATNTHILFYGFKATSGSISMIVPIPQVLIVKQSRRALVTKGITIQLTSGEFYFFAFRPAETLGDCLRHIYSKTHK